MVGCPASYRTMGPPFNARWGSQRETCLWDSQGACDGGPIDMSLAWDSHHTLYGSPSEQHLVVTTRHEPKHSRTPIIKSIKHDACARSKILRNQKSASRSPRSRTHEAWSTRTLLSTTSLTASLIFPLLNAPKSPHHDERTCAPRAESLVLKRPLRPTSSHWQQHPFRH